MAPRDTSDGRPLLVGADAGTTNTKAIVVDATGSVVAVASEPTPIAYPQPEWAEYDGEALWQGSARAIRRALDQIADPGRMVGIAFASMAETAVPLDAEGRSTGPAVAWFDKRTRAEVAEIERRIGTDRLFIISGLAPNPIFGLCKLLWHRRYRPEAFARTVKWLNVADYLAWRLCGEMATDYGLASRTFALDVSALAWSREVLDAMGVDLADGAPGRERPAAGHGRCGRRRRDRAAAPLRGRGGRPRSRGRRARRGCHAPRRAAQLHRDHRGAAHGLRRAGARPGARPGRLLARGDRGRRAGLVRGRRPVHSGRRDRLVPRTLAGDADYETLIEEAAAVPPGSLGAGFLPQLRLGTPPHPDPYARGAFFGLSTDITRGAMFRAVLEGIAADSHLCAQAMVALSRAQQPRAVRVIGGLTRNPLYMRIKASVTGGPITVVNLPDAVAMGATLLAGIGSGVYRGLADGQRQMRRDERVVEPDPAEHAFYERFVREVYAPAYPTVRPLHEAGRRLLGAGAAGG